MRLRWTIAALVCLGAAIWMLVILQKNVVLFEPVSKAIASREEQGDRPFKMSGLVVPGSIHTNDDDVLFVMTEGGEPATQCDAPCNADVRFSGSPPDLFADCAPVVVQGKWEGETFVSDQLLIKHGSDYKPLTGKMGEKCPEEPKGVR